MLKELNGCIKETPSAGQHAIANAFAEEDDGDGVSGIWGISRTI